MSLQLISGLLVTHGHASIHLSKGDDYDDDETPHIYIKNKTIISENINVDK